MVLITNKDFQTETFDELKLRKAKENVVLSPPDKEIPIISTQSLPEDDIRSNIAYEQAIQNSMYPGLSRSDYQGRRGSVVGAGYSGKNFTMPTFAAGGVEIPYTAIEKSLNAVAQEKAAAAKAGISLDSNIAEIGDHIRNIILVDKQSEYYSDLTKSIAIQSFGGDESKARQYLNVEKSTLKRAGMIWASFGRAYDVAWENYLAIKQDPQSAGQSTFSQKTRKLVKKFEDTILDTDNLDPKKIEIYSKFLTEFNQQTSIADAAKTASVNMKPIFDYNVKQLMETDDTTVIGLEKKIKAGFDNFADTALRLYGIGDYTEEQKELFKEALFMHYESEMTSNLMALGKYNPARDAKKPSKDGSSVEDFGQSPSSVIGYKTATDKKGSITSTNVITIPEGTIKAFQTSFQGNAATDKATGESYNTEMLNVNFEPRDTKVMFYAKKDLYREIPPTGEDPPTGEKELVFRKGTPITDELIELYKSVPGIMSGGYIGRKRFVEGLASGVKESTETGTVAVSKTVIVPYSDIKSDMDANLKALPEIISKFKGEENDVGFILYVSKFNQEYSTNYTYENFKNDPQYAGYIIIDE